MDATRRLYVMNWTWPVKNMIESAKPAKLAYIAFLSVMVYSYRSKIKGNQTMASMRPL